MQRDYRGFPQQMPPQRSPHGMAAAGNARRGGPPGAIPLMMAPGVPHHMSPMGHAPMQPMQPMQAMQPMHGVAPMPQQTHHLSAAGHHALGHGGHHGPSAQSAAAAAQHHQQQVAAVQQQHALAAQQQAQHHANEAAKRRSRKPTDKTLPEGVEDVVVGDGVQRYRELRDFERRLDATLTRKRLDVADSVQRSTAKRFKTLRIWISNTVENQLWQGGAGSGNKGENLDFMSSTEASYRVKIEGRLLDDDVTTGKIAGRLDDVTTGKIAGRLDDDVTTAGKESAPAEAMDTDGADAKPYAFTHFFRAMTVEVNKRKRPSGAQDMVADGPRPLVEWKRPERAAASAGTAAAAAVPEFDELTFKRPGDENVNVTIKLFRQEEPERFELDDVLAEIVDLKEATRAEAVMGLFQYVRLMGLQEDEEKRNFRCDDLMRRLVNNDMGFLPLLGEYVNAHIRPLPPVQLAYTIRVDEAFHTQTPAAARATIYDVQVAVDDPLRSQVLLPFVQNPQQHMALLREVASLDEQLAVLVQAVCMSKSKHEFLSALAKDPARFVRQWLSSQQRDLDVIMGESARGAAQAGFGTNGSNNTILTSEAWRRGGKDSVWATQNARESVNLLLSKYPLIPRIP